MKKSAKTKHADSEAEHAEHPEHEEALGHLSKKFYEKELKRLQFELVKFQYWVQHKGLKIVIIFEGRDAAGKGGVIHRIVEPLNPRGVRQVALGKPSDVE